jgi:large subunit ribosomal protein L22
LAADSLFVKEIWVGKAMTFKRYRAAKQGQARTILKPFSHLTIILEAGAPAPKKAVKKTAAKKEVKKDK